MIKEKILPRPALTFILVFIWILLANSFSILTILLGLFWGLLLPILCRNFLPQTRKINSYGRLLRFSLRVIGDIIVANIQVAKLIFQSPNKLNPAFIEIPLEIEDDFRITILSSVITLTPGTVSVDLSFDEKKLIIHSLNSVDPNETIQYIKLRYERPLMEIFYD